VREFELEFIPAHQPQPGDMAPGTRTFRSKDGRFELHGIPPRLWVIMARARGYQRFELEPLQIAEDMATEVVMPLLQGQALRGRVYDETSGAGIASVSLSFREAHVGRYEGNFRNRVSTTTSKDGSFVFDGVPAGDIILMVSAPKYVGRDIEVAIGEHTPPLQIALSSGGAINGYLVAADGVTPATGLISVNNPEERFGSGAKTNDAGEFSIEHMPPGRYRLTAASGTRSVRQEFTLAKNERKEGIVVVLSGGGRSVRGRVTGLHPADLERLHIAVFQKGSLRNGASARVDTLGAYEVQGLEPGPVLVTASINMGRQMSKALQMPADADLVANFEFQRGARVSGNVTRGGKPAAGVWLLTHPMNEQGVRFNGVRTSDSGEYVIEDVPDGLYFIDVEAHRTRAFEVNGDTVFDIDVPVAQFSGRTVEAGGKVPVVGAHIYMWSLQADANRVNFLADRTNHFGEFKVSGMEPGDYMLTAYKPGYEMHRERISHGGDREAVTIVLRQGSGVQVKVLEAGTGQPIRNAQLDETLDGRRASGIPLRLDENGVGYIPRAMAGSTLTFHARSYVPAVVSDWGGQPLEVQLTKNRPQ
jgi:hypothetical protein